MLVRVGALSIFVREVVTQFLIGLKCRTFARQLKKDAMNYLDIQKTEMTPQELDAQSIVHIDEWVTIGSPKHRDTDSEFAASNNMLELSSSNGFLQIDSLGRLWVQGIDEEMYPYHYEHGTKLIGMRIPEVALN